MRLFLLVLLCCVLQQEIFAQENSVIRSTTSASGASSIIKDGDKTYLIQQSFGQSSVIGTASSEAYVLRQGFIQPNVLAIVIEKDMPINLELSMYPNPFNNHISLAFKQEVKNNVAVTVFDILGRQVFTKTYQPLQNIDVRLDKLSSGEYILKAVANQQQFVAKIIKK